MYNEAVLFRVGGVAYICPTCTLKVGTLFMLLFVVVFRANCTIQGLAIAAWDDEGMATEDAVHGPLRLLLSVHQVAVITKWICYKLGSKLKLPLPSREEGFGVHSCPLLVRQEGIGFTQCYYCKKTVFFAVDGSYCIL